jgi:hypothetical protein
MVEISGVKNETLAISLAAATGRLANITPNVDTTASKLPSAKRSCSALPIS